MCDYSLHGVASQLPASTNCPVLSPTMSEMTLCGKYTRSIVSSARLTCRRL
jgi:hypothetical protein